MSKKLIVCDGNNLHALCYYSLKGNTSKLIESFIGILKGVVEREQEATHLIICWDSNESRKKKEDASFKAGRSPKPDNFYDAWDPLHEYLDKNDVQQYTVHDIEADDIIAKVVRAARKKQIKCVIVSNDKDMYQLIEKDDSCYIFNTLKQTWIDYEKFREEYGVEPEQFKYILALQGKASNNITGVKGIGEKNAQKIVQKYGTFDNLYASDMSEVGPKYAVKLREGKEDAYRALKQVEFLEDFGLPKTTCAGIPDLFKV